MCASLIVLQQCAAAVTPWTVAACPCAANVSTSVVKRRPLSGTSRLQQHDVRRILGADQRAGNGECCQPSLVTPGRIYDGFLSEIAAHIVILKDFLRLNENFFSS